MTKKQDKRFDKDMEDPVKQEKYVNWVEQQEALYQASLVEDWIRTNEEDEEVWSDGDD